MKQVYSLTEIYWDGKVFIESVIATSTDSNKLTTMYKEMYFVIPLAANKEQHVEFCHNRQTHIYLEKLNTI